MKNSIATLLLISGLIGLLNSQSVGAVVTSQQANTVFNLGEMIFPEYFSPSGLPTLSFPPDYPFYRGPYDSGAFMGISSDDDIYVAGGPFGFPPINVGSYSDVLAMLQDLSNTNTGDEEICDTNDIPEGLNYSQDGNEVTVTTDGCIVIDDEFNACESPATPDSQETGISVLSETTLFSSELEGITSSNPMFLDGLNNSDDTSFCTINAAPDFAPSTINTDVCFDITSIASQVAAIPGVTVTPPVTQSIESTTTNTIVDDCFATGAPVVIDNATGAVSLLQPSGAYITLP